MRRINVFAAGLALAGMASTVPSVASAAPSGGSAASGGDNLCEVVIHRNASAGVFDLARHVAQNGRCYCLVSTGPRTQGGSAEAAIVDLQQRQRCANAPLVGDAALGGGGVGAGFWIGLGLAGVGGLIAALASGGNSNVPRPASP